MSRVTVTLKKGALDYFRRLARNSKLEIQAYLVGKVVTPTLVVVDSFEYTKDYGTQTETTIAWTTPEYDRVVKDADHRAMKVVGDIHSHPQDEAVLSGADHSALVVDGFRISGICATSGRKTRVKFWVAESSLPCKVKYAKAN